MKFVLAALATIVVVTSAVAADLPPPIYAKGPDVASTYNWSGFYVGGTLGGAFGSSDPATTTVYSATGFFDPSAPSIASISKPTS
jgi:outer membrane immunogenic protein